MPNPILDQARARLSAIAAEKAALDVEERELRAMVAAADGVKAQPVPLPQPFAVPWPSVPILPSWEPVFPSPIPHPLTPWIVGAPHGGMCACPTCRTTVYCSTDAGWSDLSPGIRVDAAPAWDCNSAGIADATGLRYVS